MSCLYPGTLAFIKGRWSCVDKDHIRSFLHFDHLLVPCDEFMFQFSFEPGWFDRTGKYSCQWSSLFTPFVKSPVEDTDIPEAIPDQAVRDHCLFQSIAYKGATPG